jgi:type II secretory pathway pseudopilin PulG
MFSGDIGSLLSGVVVAVVSLLGTLITTKVIPWLKARTTAEQRKLIASLVKTAVRAAEQLYNAGKLETGEDKNAYVKTALLNEGVTLSDKEVDVYIEAAVLEVHLEKEWALRQQFPALAEGATPPTVEASAGGQNVG